MNEETKWNVHRRKDDGAWVVQYRLANQTKWLRHRISAKLGIRTERQAELYARTWIASGAANEAAAKAPPLAPVAPVTLRSLSGWWLDTYVAKAPRDRYSEATKRQFRSVLETHVLTHPIADQPIDQLGTRALRQWVRDVRDRGKRITERRTGPAGVVEVVLVGRAPLSASTTRNVHNSLVAFFRACMAEEKITLASNPAQHPMVTEELPSAAKHGPIAFIPIEVAEAVILSPEVDAWVSTQFAFSCLSGLRPGEVAGLKWRDVVTGVEVPHVRVERALVQKGENGHNTLGPLKTKGSARLVPLHVEAIRLMAEWKASGWRTWTGRDPDGDDPVFPNHDGEHWRASDAAERTRAALRAAGQSDLLGDAPATAHAMRRSFATWLGDRGVEESTVQALMGHTGSSTLSRHYSAATLVRLRAAVSQIPLSLSRGQVIPFPRAQGG